MLPVLWLSLLSAIYIYIDPPTHYLLMDILDSVASKEYFKTCILFLSFGSALCGMGVSLTAANRKIAFGFSILASVTIVYGIIQEQISGHPFSPFDAAVAIQEFNFADSAFTEIVLPIAQRCIWMLVFAACIPICVYLSKVRRRSNLFGVLLISLTAIFFTNRYALHNLNHFPSFYSIPGNFLYGYLMGPYYHEREKVDLQSSSEVFKTKHLVLIVDESISARFFTSAPIKKQILDRGIALFDYGVATSSWNCSAPSNLILRVGLSPALPEAWPQKALSLPTIFQFARSAGFKTYYILNQNTKNFLSKYDIDAIDSFRKVTDIDCSTYGDCQTIPSLHEALSSDTPTFSIVVKRGSHFPYFESYPNSYRDRLHGASSYEERVLHYKKSIEWNVEKYWLEGLLPLFNSSDVTILYTSDHGQHLSPDRLLPHCTPTDPAIDEYEVPILVATNSKKVSDILGGAFETKSAHATHYDLFPTLLNLLGYDATNVMQRYGPSLFDRVNQPRRINWGYLFGEFFHQNSREQGELSQ